eukprot:TRINITY_DN7638_c0_g1_i4.p1 TRINITY_DN7638_c0_g1~~TRINITY_DN7638_c0_g1_i4.p1  ORF type:complete len:394 (+),score=18.05 TRINITY_DN7638_c0_g1_i4:49-1182(+)
MATLSSLLPSIYHQPRALSDQISLVTSDVNFPGTQENSISRNLISFAGHFSPTCTSASRSCPFVPILSQSNSSPIFISPDSTSTSSSSFGLGYSSVSNCSACCKQLRASASPPAFSRPLTSFSCFRKSSSPFPVRPPSISHSRYCILTFAKNQSRPRPNSQAAEDTGSFHRNTLRETATNVASELLKNVKRSDASSVSEPNVTAEAASLSPLQPAGTAIANFQSQNITTAAVRACKAAISSNSIPAFRTGESSPSKEPKDLDGLRHLATSGGSRQVWLLDQFGVLHDGKKAYPGAIEALEKLHSTGAIMILISNSSKRSQVTIDKLPSLGFNPDLFAGVVTSGELTHQALLKCKLMVLLTWSKMSAFHMELTGHYLA